MTSGGGRRRGRGQRLLYFFRTPPGVRVGRAAIDEDAIRLIEQHNPDVQFDWTRILKSPQQAAQEPGRREDRRRREQPPAQPAASGPLPASGSQLPAAGFTLPASEPGEPSEPLEPGELGEPAEPEEPAEPGPLEAGNWEPEAGSWELEAGSREPEADLESRYARIGSEGLARLRARYAEVLARIAEKPLEEAAREELRNKAERLNPDAWVTEDEVGAALEQYETVFEELRAVVGRYPRRRRRRRL